MNKHTYQAFFRSIGKKIFFVIFLFAVPIISFCQLSVDVANPFHRYEKGDTIVYTVVAAPGDYEYTITQDKLLPDVGGGALSVKMGKYTKIFFLPSEPGNYFCHVTKGSLSATTVAAYDVPGLVPLETIPPDYDAFWKHFKKRLDAIPMDPIVTLDNGYTGSFSKTYHISLGSIDGHRAYGYMTVPNTTGAFTGLVSFPAFGNSNAAKPSIEMAERLGAIVISLSIHNSPVDINIPESDVYNPDIAFTDTVYYQWAIAAGMRAIDYIETRQDFDGEHIGVFGVSQGGGLAMILAGVDERVDLVAVSNPVMSQHCGLKYGKPSGFVKYISDFTQDPVEMNRILDAVKYYDAVYACAKFKGKFYATTSLMDEVTPSETTYVAYNQLEQIVHLHNLNGLHKDNPTEFWDGRFDFFRRYFPINNSWPWVSASTSFDADAGPDRVCDGMDCPLEGVIDKNGEVPESVSVRWEKVSGPGEIEFKDPNSTHTVAVFSKPGIYKIRLRAEESSQLIEASKFFSMKDIVEINVCPSNDCMERPLRITDFKVALESAKVRMSWHTKHEKDNSDFALIRSADNAVWERLKFIPTKNELENDYVIFDEHPMTGINYYQIVHLAKDGARTASIIESISFQEVNKISPRVFPNPAAQAIEFRGLGEESLMLHVINEVGQTLMTVEASEAKSLDIKNLPKGNYYFRFSDGTESFYRKVVILAH